MLLVVGVVSKFSGDPNFDPSRHGANTIGGIELKIGMTNSSLMSFSNAWNLLLSVTLNSCSASFYLSAV